MTQKDYVLLAEVVRKLDEETTPSKVAQKIAEVCEGDNPRFNYNRFYKACGLMK